MVLIPLSVGKLVFLIQLKSKALVLAPIIGLDESCLANFI